MTWGNVGVTVSLHCRPGRDSRRGCLDCWADRLVFQIFLFLTRSAYFLGLFGEDASDLKGLDRQKLQYL